MKPNSARRARLDSGSRLSMLAGSDDEGAVVVGREAFMPAGILLVVGVGISFWWRQISHVRVLHRVPST